MWSFPGRGRSAGGCFYQYGCSDVGGGFWVGGWCGFRGWVGLVFEARLKVISPLRVLFRVLFVSGVSWWMYVCFVGSMAVSFSSRPR